jgi:hypothetical protein
MRLRSTAACSPRLLQWVLPSPEVIDVIVRAYAHVARPYILRWFPERNNCIAACRATIEALDSFGIHAWPLSVRMQAKVKERKLGFGMGLLPEEAARARKKAGARTYSPFRRGWPGHLIVGTENHWLIDPTFDTTFDAFRMLGYDCGEQNYVMAVQWHEDINPLAFSMDASFGLNDGHTLEVKYLSSPNEDYRDAPAWETDHLQPLIWQLGRAIIDLARAPVITPTEPAAAQAQSRG